MKEEEPQPPLASALRPPARPSLPAQPQSNSSRAHQSASRAACALLVCGLPCAQLDRAHFNKIVAGHRDQGLTDESVHLLRSCVEMFTVLGFCNKNHPGAHLLCRARHFVDSAAVNARGVFVAATDLELISSPACENYDNVYLAEVGRCGVSQL
jgi:hypothetical protein